MEKVHWLPREGLPSMQQQAEMRQHIARDQRAAGTRSRSGCVQAEEPTVRTLRYDRASMRPWAVV
jgi:hypothetical protein